MADYDIFRDQLGARFPAYGHALWDPSPRKPDRPVKVGDVGFIRRGKFHCLFNALCPKDEQSDVPEGYQQLVPRSLDHITRGSLNCGHYCSVGVGVESGLDIHSSGPDDFRRTSFSYSGRRGGAVLSLPVRAQREDTLAQSAFSEWIVKNIDHWFAFARQLELGIEQMEEIILVTGCDRTKSWTNVAFLGGQDDGQASFGVKVSHGHDTSINIQFSPGHVVGAVLNHGSEGKNLPQDQGIFIRGFRVARTFKIFPKRLKAAAGTSPESDGYDCEPDTELIPIPATTKYRDPLHLLLDYIAEEAPDCDMALVHDDDLERIDGMGQGTSLETFQPDVFMDLLRRSNIEIHKVCCDLSPSSSSPNTDTHVVQVAMLSMLSQGWNINVRSQPSPHLTQNPSSRCPSESLLPPPPASLGTISFPLKDRANDQPPGPVLQDLPDTNAPLHRLRRVADVGLPALDKIAPSLSSVWSNLSKFTDLKYHKLVYTIVVTCYLVSFSGWIFSFSWPIISKLWFTLLLASFALSVWFEREHTHRRFDEMRERIEALQHHIMSLQSNTAIPVLVADARNNFPIMAKTTPANQEMMGQSTQAIMQPAIAEPSGHGEPLVDISHSPQSKVGTLRKNTSSSVESSTFSLVDGAAEQHNEHLGANTGSGFSHAAITPFSSSPESIPVPIPPSFPSPSLGRVSPSESAMSSPDIYVRRLSTISERTSPPSPPANALTSALNFASLGDLSDLDDRYHSDTTPVFPPADFQSQRSANYVYYVPAEPYDRSEPTFQPSPPPPADTRNLKKSRVRSSFNPFKSVFSPRPSIRSSDVTTASPPADTQRKTRSSRFFNPIKFAFPTRRPSPIPPSHTADTTIVYPPSQPPEPHLSSSIEFDNHSRPSTPFPSPPSGFGSTLPRDKLQIE